MNKTFTFLIVVFLMVSCKTSKVTDNSVDYLPPKTIVKNNSEVVFNRTSVKASMQVKYRGKADMPNLNASMRILKDSVIWLNFSKLGFPVAKIIITPQQVKFYEKIGFKYFGNELRFDHI